MVRRLLVAPAWLCSWPPLGLSGGTSHPKPSSARQGSCESTNAECESCWHSGPVCSDVTPAFQLELEVVGLTQLFLKLARDVTQLPRKRSFVKFFWLCHPVGGDVDNESWESTWKNYYSFNISTLWSQNLARFCMLLNPALGPDFVSQVKTFPFGNISVWNLMFYK